MTAESRARRALPPLLPKGRPCALARLALPRALRPVLTFPHCLNPEIIPATSLGTAATLARRPAGRVLRESRLAYCKYATLSYCQYARHAYCQYARSISRRKRDRSAAAFESEELPHTLLQISRCGRSCALLNSSCLCPIRWQLLAGSCWLIRRFRVAFFSITARRAPARSPPLLFPKAWLQASISMP